MGTPSFSAPGGQTPGWTPSPAAGRTTLWLALLTAIATLALAPAPAQAAAPDAATTTPATGVTSTTATLNGTVTPGAQDATCTFQYGTTTAYGTSAACTPATVTPGSPATAVSADLTGLTPDTVYHYRVVATGGGGETDGADATFTTVATPTADTLTMTTATLHGNVNAQGDTAATYHFLYGAGNTADIPTPDTPMPATDTFDHPVSAQLAGLQPGATYSIRLVVTVNGQTLNSDLGQFSTGPPPAATTGVASDVTTTSATLTGTVDTRGLAGQFRFYLSDGSATAPVTLAAASGPRTVSATVTGLQPGRSYDFFVWVQTDNGVTATGDNVSFTTAPATAAQDQGSAAQAPATAPSPYGCSNPQLDTPPPGARPGQQVTLTGSDLGVGGSVHFGSRQVPAQTWSATAITFTVPDDATGNVPVAVGCSNLSNSVTFSFPLDAFTATAKPIHHRRALRLTFTLAGPGVVRVSGRDVTAIRHAAAHPGSLTLTVPLTKRALRHSPHRTTLLVRFTPTGGATAQRTLRVRLA